ncbi:MAG: DedA family protein [Gammaproteobacteria bacterium]|nr:DedA family protein [Gammaproteobacteria bacterium]MCP5423486.1 DedA family protein [Gammaproteobacteria bacterium]
MWSGPFGWLQDQVMIWAKHRHAPWFLGGLSFAESSFFPIPPDVMLAPMSLVQPHRAWRFALLTTLASVLGGLFGYLLGSFLFDLIEPMLQRAGYWPAYLQARDWFDRWGFWAMFLAGFSPIPYKVFTITAGTLSMALLPFVAASVIGRGMRFYLVAALMRWGGARMETMLRKHIDSLGWLTVIVALLVYLVVANR